MKYHLITDNESLYTLCCSVTPKAAFALDTEFIRTHTYYPQMGLIQFFDGCQLALIDPLEITDWTAFYALMADPSHLKYFHACSEDLDVFQHQFGWIPTPIIDSQIVASFLDNPLCASYANLVKKYMQIPLSKNATRTDWLARPLSQDQCRYAAEDVYYLLPLMTMLIDTVKEAGWFDAAREECLATITKKTENVLPQQAYLTFKKVSQLKGKQRSYLQLLAAWRLEYAREHDIALNFVLPEQLLWKIARYQPTSLGELKALGARGKEIRLYGNTMLNLLKQPVQNPEPLARNASESPNYKRISEALKLAAEAIAKDTGLSEAVLLSRRHINHYVDWLNRNKTGSEPEIISGWRAALFMPYLPIALHENKN